MPHADSLALPPEATSSKSSFYTHVETTLLSLLAPNPIDRVQGNWVTQLANAAALLNGSYENYGQKFGRVDGRRVNWCGFYLIPSLFPQPQSSIISLSALSLNPFESSPEYLLLGPFAGRPACLEIPLVSVSKRRPLGVCAKGFLGRKTVVVDDVELEEGHIACDGATRSEIVVPILISRSLSSSSKGDGAEEEEKICVGVLDVDCEREGAFDEEDRIGLEKIVEAIDTVVKWNL